MIDSFNNEFTPEFNGYIFGGAFVQGWCDRSQIGLKRFFDFTIKRKSPQS